MSGLLLINSGVASSTIFTHYDVLWHSVEITGKTPSDEPGSGRHIYTSGRLPDDMQWQLLQMQEIQSFLTTHNAPEHWFLAVDFSHDKLDYITLPVQSGQPEGWRGSLPDKHFFNGKGHLSGVLKGNISAHLSGLATIDGGFYHWHPGFDDSLASHLTSLLVLEFSKSASSSLLERQQSSDHRPISPGTLLDTKWFWFPFFMDFAPPSFFIDFEPVTADPESEDSLDEFWSDPDSFQIHIQWASGEESSCVLPRSYFEHMAESDLVDPGYWYGLFTGEMRVSGNGVQNLNRVCEAQEGQLSDNLQQVVEKIDVITAMDGQRTKAVSVSGSGSESASRERDTEPPQDNQQDSRKSHKMTGGGQSSASSSPPMVVAEESGGHRHSDIIIHQAQKEGSLLHLPLSEKSVVQSFNNGAAPLLESEHNHLNLITALDQCFSQTRITGSNHEKEPIHYRTEQGEEMDVMLPPHGAAFLFDSYCGISQLQVCVQSQDGKAELFSIHEAGEQTFKELLNPETKKELSDRCLEQSYRIPLISTPLRLQLENGRFCAEKTHAIEVGGCAYPILGNPYTTGGSPQFILTPISSFGDSELTPVRRGISGNLCMIYDARVVDEESLIRSLAQSTQVPEARVFEVDSEHSMKELAPSPEPSISIQAHYAKAQEQINTQDSVSHIYLLHGSNPHTVTGANRVIRLLSHHVDRMERYLTASSFDKQCHPEFREFSPSWIPCEFEPFIKEGEKLKTAVKVKEQESLAKMVYIDTASNIRDYKYLLGHRRGGTLLYQNPQLSRELIPVDDTEHSDPLLASLECYTSIRRQEADLKNKLQEGSNGYIYKAELEGGTFAVKKTDYRPIEFNLFKSFDHPNIAPLIAAFHRGRASENVGYQVAYYVMPVMQTDLEKVIKSSGSWFKFLATATGDGQNPAVRLNMASCILNIIDGLSYLHRQDVGHYDIKPANILIKLNPGCQCPSVYVCSCPKSPMAIIADFDHVRLLDKDGTLPAWPINQKTGQPYLPGTPRFNCPELVFTESDIKHCKSVQERRSYHLAADSFSLGAVVLWLCSGETIDRNKLEKAYKQYRVEKASEQTSSGKAEEAYQALWRTDWATASEGIPEELKRTGLAFILSCFRFDPTQRPAMNEVREEPFIKLLIHWLRQRSDKALPESSF